MHKRSGDMTRAMSLTHLRMVVFGATLIQKEMPLAQLLIRKLNDLQTIKVSGTLQVKYTKPTYTGVDQDTKPYFHTKPFTLLHASQVQETIDFIFEELGERMYNYEGEGSGWVFDKVISFQVNIHKHVPLRASSYMEIPAEVQNTKSVVNIQNKDHKCFMWSILAYLHPAHKTPQRVSKYQPFQDELTFQGIDFPVKLQDISKFETQNQISVNVFGYDPEHWIYPLRITKAEHQKHVDLLYVVDKENSHYCLIKSFNGLMHRHSKNQKKKFFCKHCLHGFCREELLREHQPDCMGCEWSPEDSSSRSRKQQLAQFTNHHKGLKVPVTESALNTTTNQKFVCRELVFSCTTAVLYRFRWRGKPQNITIKGKILIKTSQSEREGVLTANGRSRTKEGIRLMRRRSRLPTRRYYVILWYTWTRARSP